MNEATVVEKKAYKHLFDTSRHRELVYTDAEIKASTTGKDLPYYVSQPTWRRRWHRQPRRRVRRDR